MAGLGVLNFPNSSDFHLMVDINIVKIVYKLLVVVFPGELYTF